MKVTYDAEDDSLRILFRNAPIHESESTRQGLILDFDQHGAIVGIELKPASEYVGRLTDEPFFENIPSTHLTTTSLKE